MNNDLHAKALRAAEWWNSPADYRYVDRPESEEGWVVSEALGTLFGGKSLPNRMFIAFCEGRGWIDSAEDEGVDWEWSYEQGWFGPYLLSTRSVCDEFEWTLTSSSGAPECVMLRGEAPTRAEARRAALEAARGLG